MKNISFAYLFLFMLWSTSAAAQTSQTQALIDASMESMRDKSRADSLANLAVRTASDMNDYPGHFKSIYTLGRISEYHLQIDSASYFYGKALDLAAANDEPSDIARMLYENSYMQEMLGNRDSAIQLVEKGISINHQLNDSLNLLTGYRYLGYFYNNGGYHEKAITCYLKALEIADALDKAVDVAASYQGIGIIYNKQNDFVKAKQYFQKAMEAFSAIQDTLGMIGVHNDFGILNKNQGNFAAAEREYLKNLEYSKIPRFRRAKKSAYNNLGILYYNMHQFDKSVEYLEKGVAISREEGSKGSESNSLNYLAKSQLEMGNIKEAITHADRSLRLANEANVLEKERDAALTLSIAYEKDNQNELALKYYKLHKVFYDSIYNTEKSAIIHGLEQQYETAQKDKEISLLEKEAELSKVRTARLWILLIASGLLGALLFWVQRMRMTKQKAIETERRKVAELKNQQLHQELDFKKKELASKVLQLCRKNEFLTDLANQVKDIKAEGVSSQQLDKLGLRINRDIDTDADWALFLQSFETVHPDFNKKINEVHPDLSSGEHRMACLMKMNLDSKEVASLLNISLEGVKKARYRMRKKMKLDSAENLNSYFLKF